MIRAEINRGIVITDSNGRHTVTTKHAVVRALAAGAMRGGVLAQRSYLKLTQKEEQRHRKEKRKSFRYWTKYKNEAAARIAAGAPPPDDDPHPDDIKLDWRTQEVRIEGPIDKEDRDAAKIGCVLRDLAYEMALYRDELTTMCDGDGRVVQMGWYFGLYLVCNHRLWPKMRKPPGAYDKVIWRGVLLGRKSWRNKLAKRCKKLELPFLPRKDAPAPLMIPLVKLGIRKPITLRVRHTEPPPRSRRRRREDKG